MGGLAAGSDPPKNIAEDEKSRHWKAYRSHDSQALRQAGELLESIEDAGREDHSEWQSEKQCVHDDVEDHPSCTAIPARFYVQVHRLLTIPVHRHGHAPMTAAS
jgi:hypothetical protein